MNILLIGATGAIGSRILTEAVNRKHYVTAVARNASSLEDGDRVRVFQGDAKDQQQLTLLAENQDAMVVSISPRGDRGRENYLASIQSALAAAQAEQVPYVLFVGGGSSLFTADGRRILDQMLEQIPAEKLSEPITVAEARALVEKSGANWTFFCPPVKIQPGERTGKFRVGGQQALFDLDNPGSISMEDYAVAALDELEHPRHRGQIFHALY